MNASAAASSTKRRKAPTLKPLPRNTVNQLNKIRADNQPSFSTDFLLPNTPQFERNSPQKKNPLPDLTKISEGRSSAKSKSPPKSPLKLPPKPSSKSPPKASSQHMLPPPPAYIPPTFVPPKRSQYINDNIILKELNTLFYAYVSLILKFKNNQNVNIFSFTKILNKIFAKTKYFKYFVEEYNQDLLKLVDNSKKLIRNYMKYIIDNVSRYRELYEVFDEKNHYDISERETNYDEMLILISKDIIFQFDFQGTVYVQEDGKRGVPVKFNTTTIYTELYNIMYNLFYFLRNLLNSKKDDNAYIPDILKYCKYYIEWLEQNKNFIMYHIPITHRVDKRFENNKLSVSSISNVETHGEWYKFLPVIFYDIKDKKLIIYRLDFINTRMYELKKVHSSISPLLQILNLLILMKALLRMKSYTFRDGKHQLINGHVKREILDSIKEFEVKLKNSDHIIGMGMHNMMFPDEIVKLNLVKELNKIVESMNDYYGRKGLLFRANQVRRFFTKEQEAPDLAANIYEINNLKRLYRENREKRRR
jgi:hypothetical protein